MPLFPPLLSLFFSCMIRIKIQHTTCHSKQSVKSSALSFFFLHNFSVLISLSFCLPSEILEMLVLATQPIYFHVVFVLFYNKIVEMGVLS